MDKLYIFLVFGSVAAAGLVIVFLLIKKPGLLKKYWKYLLGALGTLVGVLSLGWITSRWGRDTPAMGDAKTERKAKKLEEDLGISRVEMEDELEQAREKEQEVKEELEKIDNIDDEAERLQALADLWNKRRGR